MKNVQTTEAVEGTRVQRAWGLSMAIIIAVLIIDQAIKLYVKSDFSLFERREVTSWFHLVFIENEGIAYGMKIMGTFFLTLFRLAAVGLFFWLLHKAIKRNTPKGLLCCIALIIAGALGNIIDNSLYGLIFSESTPFSAASFVPIGEGYGSFLSGKVVDMFSFTLFTWPDWVPVLGGKVFFNAIFNFAEESTRHFLHAFLIEFQIVPW